MNSADDQPLQAAAADSVTPQSAPADDKPAPVHAASDDLPPVTPMAAPVAKIETPARAVDPASAIAPAAEAAPMREAPVLTAPARRDGDPAPLPAKASRINRFALLAASLTLAAAIGGAAGAAGFTGAAKLRTPSDTAKSSGLNRAELSDELKGVRDSIGQIRTSLRTMSESVATLRGQIDAKANAAQFAKLQEAIERVERAQAEPAAKLAKAAEALERVEKRSSAPAAPEVTGSVAAPHSRNLTVPPAAEPATLRLPVLDGWHIRRVINGVAIIEGRMGVVEAEVGDTIPGLGRIDDMKRQDGRWVVVTNRGVVQSR
ncbi:MAG: hypothetical protein QOD74_1068 [Variibacter sp.]|jgi:hypothetical protein|nr:hypothetical protein [Variibacter sp.]